MCSNVINVDGQELACRKCNQCITARKNGWVARAMAERATAQETYSITLTYNDETQENRDGAKSFEYRHVRGLLARLRRDIYARTGKVGQVRFICAGEIGSDKGRCHYHLLLFTNSDIFKCGEYTSWPNARPVPERWQKITEGKKKRRLNWSMWPHGFVTFQEPDQWGVEYAIAYALKDQFNVVSAEGTMREAKVSSYASGLFRMSKRPPIGWTFLDAKLTSLEDRGQLPVSLKVKVPEYKGYWYPTGTMREYMIDRIRIANELHIAEHGKNAPQWTALVASVAQSEKDWERLINGTEEEEEQKLADDIEEHKLSILLRTKEIRQAQRDRDTRSRCGKVTPCQRCVNSLTAEDFDKSKKFAQQQRDKHGSWDAANKAWRKENRPNPFCNYRELQTVRRVFKK